MPVCKALISQDIPSDSQLEITIDGSPVTSPYVVTLRLVNRGRRNIRSSDFDRDIPITLNLGVPVVSILKNQVVVLEHLSSVDMGTGRVSFGPSLIHSGEKIGIDVLTDGQPVLSCTDRLADVKVRAERPDSALQRLLVPLIGLVGGSALIAAGSVASIDGDTPAAIVSYVSGILMIAAAIAFTLFPCGHRNFS
jgi:hypothetical protein